MAKSKARAVTRSKRHGRLLAATWSGASSPYRRASEATVDFPGNPGGPVVARSLLDAAAPALADRGALIGAKVVLALRERRSARSRSSAASSRDRLRPKASVPVVTARQAGAARRARRRPPAGLRRRAADLAALRQELGAAAPRRQGRRPRHPPAQPLQRPEQDQGRVDRSELSVRWATRRSRTTTPFAFEVLYLGDEDGRAIAGAVIKATFDVAANGALELAEEQRPVDLGGEHWGDPETSSYKFEPEVAFCKPATDVALVGHAHAPRARATQMLVRFQVGTLPKTLRVSGDARLVSQSARAWSRAPRSRSRRSRSATTARSAAGTAATETRRRTVSSRATRAASATARAARASSRARRCPTSRTPRTRSRPTRGRAFRPASASRAPTGIRA